MKSLWPESFEENPLEPPKALFEEQARLLPKITGEIVFAELVDEIRGGSLGIPGEFCYRFNIVGKFIGDYRFRVLSFSHNITLYPVKLNLDSELGKELGIEAKANYLMSIQSPDELKILINAVLKSERILKVIGSIIKLSK